jgi:hypothetical protein
VDAAERRRIWRDGLATVFVAAAAARTPWLAPSTLAPSTRVLGAVVFALGLALQGRLDAEVAA